MKDFDNNDPVDNLNGVEIEKTRVFSPGEDIYRRIVETANAGIWVIDREGRITLVNEKLARMLGYRKEEMTGLPMESFMFPEDRELHRMRMDERRKGLSGIYEQRFPRKDGGECWLHVSATALRDEEGEFSGAFAMLTDTTARRMEAESIRENEARLRAVLEAVTESLFLMNREGMVLVANRTMAQRLRMTPGEVEGCIIYDLLTEELAENRRMLTEEAFRTGLPVQFVDERFGRRMENSIYPIFDERGEPSSLAVYGRDVTDRMKAEERFRLIFSHSPVGAATVAPDFTFLHANEALCRFIGYSEAELRRMTFVRITHPESREQDLEQISRLLSGEIPLYTTDKRYIHKDGHHVWGRLSVSLVRDFDNTPLYFLPIIQDITESKKAEEALRESEGRLRSIFLAAPVGIGITCNRVITDVNDTMCRMTGYAREEMLGKSSRMLYPDRPEYERAGREKYSQIREQGTGAVETRWVRKDGTEINVILSSTPMRPEDPYRDVTFTAMDITELRASLREKEVLLREVHHRVKNNLAAIIGLLQMQQKEILDQRVSSSLDDLVCRINTMALVHERLYLSENMARIDFQDFLKPLTSYLCAFFGSASPIRCKVEAEGIEMGLDLAVPCALIINELFTNAVKHAFPGGEPGVGAEISEICVSMKTEGDEYVLTVADNGAGFPHGSNWRTLPTMGLRLVTMLGEHQLGGRIRLDNSRGTRFELRFSPGHGRKSQ
ncbi:MAG: PAS domain S-box protein [Geobacteraceae bacterium]|nr:PAS domain S-box protein [Geobacteraceae bacterium]